VLSLCIVFMAVGLNTFFLKFCLMLCLLCCGILVYVFVYYVFLRDAYCAMEYLCCVYCAVKYLCCVYCAVMLTVLWNTYVVFMVWIMLENCRNVMDWLGQPA